MVRTVGGMQVLEKAGQQTRHRLVRAGLLRRCGSAVEQVSNRLLTCSPHQRPCPPWPRWAGGTGVSHVGFSGSSSSDQEGLAPPRTGRYYTTPQGLELLMWVWATATGESAEINRGADHPKRHFGDAWPSADHYRWDNRRV